MEGLVPDRPGANGLRWNHHVKTSTTGLTPSTSTWEIARECNADAVGMTKEKGGEHLFVFPEGEKKEGRGGEGASKSRSDGAGQGQGVAVQFFYEDCRGGGAGASGQGPKDQGSRERGKEGLPGFEGRSEANQWNRGDRESRGWAGGGAW